MNVFPPPQPVNRQLSSVDIAARTQLAATLDFIREGDTLVVTKLDRLARSVNHLMQIIDDLSAKSAHLRIIGLGIDAAGPTGKLILTVLGGMAEFERGIMLERQREGIAKPPSSENRSNASLHPANAASSASSP